MYVVFETFHRMWTCQYFSLDFTSLHGNTKYYFIVYNLIDGGSKSEFLLIKYHWIQYSESSNHIEHFRTYYAYFDTYRHICAEVYWNYELFYFSSRFEIRNKLLKYLHKINSLTKVFIILTGISN